MRRVAAGLVAVVLVAVSCGGDDVADEDGQVTSEQSTTTTTATGSSVAPSTTELPAPSAGEASLWPWHATGSAHDDPADAVREFVEYFGFGEPVVLGEFQQGDARSGEIQILPPFLGEPFVLPFPEGSDAATEYARAPEFDGELGAFWGWAGPTTAFVRLDDDDNWVVIGALSAGLVVDSPAPNSAVSSPFDVLFTSTAMTWRLEVQVWPDGAAEPTVDEDVTGGTGVFSIDGEVFAPVEWDQDAAGSATLVVTSGDPVFAVTTVRLELDPAVIPATLTDPVGDRRREILYQPDLRLSVYGADDCGEGPRPTIVTSRGFTSYREELVDVGYVVVEAQLRTSGATPTLDEALLRAVGLGASDLGVAVQWLRAHADELCIDSDRIAAAGYSISAGAALALAYSVGELQPGDTITIPELGSSIELGDDTVPSAGPPELATYSGDIAAVVSFAGFALVETIDAGEPPAFLVHGRNDPAAPFALAEQTCAAATAVGVRCELFPYDGGHELPTDTTATITAIDEFLRQELEISEPAGS